VDGHIIAQLKKAAVKLRCDVIKMVTAAGSGHIGGSFSAAEIVAYLYFHRMRIDPKNPRWPDRDRFILSKGHCAPIQYAALANRGYFPQSELMTLRDLGSRLQGHPDMKKLPGIDMTTGSLGQGLSCAVGMALAAKLDGKDYTVYVLLGDGEIQSGQVWEAAMAAAQFRLDNLVAVLDNNGLQSDDVTSHVIGVNPVAGKWAAFNWDVQQACGHDFTSLDAAFTRCNEKNGRPKFICADTVKGKCVSFMENAVKWHSGAPAPEEARAALAELEAMHG
jgi:transketolase